MVSEALDYWAVEDTEETHGEFTQKEWAEIREVDLRHPVWRVAFVVLPLG